MSFRKVLYFTCIIAITFLPLFSAINYYIWTKAMVPSTPTMPDGITVWENRLSKIKNDLPRQGIVGYIADWDLPEGKTSTDQETEYRLTQYTLAPLIISRDTNQQVLVGNISSRIFDDRLASYFNVNIVHDYGFGIYLLEKRK